MKRRSIWFWLGIAYLVATVTYNVYGLRYSYPFFDRNDQVAIAINLGAKIMAIPLLMLGQVTGVGLLGIAFVTGVSAIIWDFYRFHNWATLPLLNKISTINGILISLAVLIYMSVALRSSEEQ